MTDEYQSIIIVNSILPFINDAVYNIYSLYYCLMLLLLLD